MKVLVTGYLREENRHSMVRTGETIHRHVQPLLGAGDSVLLAERGDAALGTALNYGSLSVKLKKRFLEPAKWWRSSYDVLHLVDSDYAFGIPPWAFGRTVVTCHDMMAFLQYGGLDAAYPGRFGRYCFGRVLKNLARCARVVCVSEFTKECVLKYTECREEQLVVVHQGVDSSFRALEEGDAAVAAFREAHDLVGKRVVLHVGSCAPYKNIETVLRVFAAVVAASDEEIVLLKVGGAFSEGQQALIEELGLGERLRHVTGLSEEGLCCAYNAADLLLWPSWFEGFGLPVLEAMACGTPVVCSNGGALAEVAGDAARVHEADHAGGLAGSCREILGDGSVAAGLRAAGLGRAAGFSWEATAAGYLGVYRGVAG